MQEPAESRKWERKTTAVLKASAAEKVWPLLADFCNLHKIFPKLATCYQVEGVSGQQGLIRYCETPPTNPADESTVKWVKEKLLMIDPIKRCISYEIIENNMGFHSYVATMQVVPTNDIDQDGAYGCKIDWSVVCEPVDGWRSENLQEFLESNLQLVAKTMEHALLST
ncbi:lachrymatory-factor synthase-like [Pyrus x bretschneideri]|uniref:lachrymatory-factor synthase-like n=1 Tax=Pyrus x bretschneideri TaxID=225117 RepID=UPI002030C996|nr:lachrymatory-factor synthase-like [Pyrus x bretschneideri]